MTVDAQDIKAYMPSDLWHTKDPLRRLLRRMMDGGSWYPTAHMTLGRNVNTLSGVAGLPCTEEEWRALMSYIWPELGEEDGPASEMTVNNSKGTNG